MCIRDRVGRFHADAIHPYLPSIDETIVQACHENGVEINAWTKMCIRDSPSRAFKTFPERKKREKLLPQNSFLYNTHSVSYTHLDVYKRQVNNIPFVEGRRRSIGRQNRLKIKRIRFTGIQFDLAPLPCTPVSYTHLPTFDLSTYNENYTALLNDPDQPLFNRALDGAFACGSTMKPGVALAALTEGVITPGYTYTCHKVYNRFSDYKPTCMGTHYTINVVTALAKSCNIFFYETGFQLGIEKMNAYSALYLSLIHIYPLHRRQCRDGSLRPAGRAADRGPWRPRYRPHRHRHPLTLPGNSGADLRPQWLGGQTRPDPVQLRGRH